MILPIEHDRNNRAHTLKQYTLKQYRIYRVDTFFLKLTQQSIDLINSYERLQSVDKEWIQRIVECCTSVPLIKVAENTISQDMDNFLIQFCRGLF